ncbi:MAG: hypothetical protein Phog2KO_02190 [Phototrophicaceae bacterium]
MKKLIDNTVVLGVLFALIALITLITYVLTSLDAGQGNLLMPLDDVYIHFQYARQLATGHPYQYNLIDPPTSGATSLLYPYILAFGYLIGFKGLWLGLWAMIVGTIALFASMIAVYRLCKVLDVPQWLSVLTATSFGLTGSIAWHFMSGMETGIIITLLLWVLLFVIEKRLFPFLIIAIFLTITRPEGGLVSAIASGTLFLRLWQDYSKENKRAYLLLLAIPILAIGLQPLVNLLITGTTVATGAQAKSILSSVPQDYGVIIGQIWDNFSRMWLEFITGYDIREGRGWYFPIFTGLIGLGAIPLLLFKKNYRLIGLMLLGWFLILTLALSTLDNAFWHFKRYQMPMLALFFPLSAWVVADALRRFPKMRYSVYAFDALVLPVFVIALFVQFQHYHAINVAYVYQQPYQMGIWLRDNTPEDALVAVHDVGLMRYVSGRSTLDIVGLTTPNAASYWRNGPGSVAEFLLNERPDYIASYGRGHGYGLAYLADTSLYANQLADFTIDDWQAHLNVALAAPSQGIYQPDWDNIYSAGQFTEYVDYWLTDAPLYEINIADIASESEFDYQWFATENIGFDTEVRDMAYRYTGLVSEPFVDGLRLINGYEQFTFYNVDTTLDALLVTRVHSANSGTIDIYINQDLFQSRVIPQNAGNWLDLPTLIPANMLTETLTVEIRPQITDGFYMPAYHQLSQFEFETPQSSDTYMASFQDNHLRLVDMSPRFDARYGFQLVLGWEVETGEGDYRLFVHLYDDINQPPLAQDDDYLNGNTVNAAGSQTLGNLLPSQFTDVMTLDTTHLPAGTYQLAIGFYNPNDPTDRLIPESDVYEVSPDGRLWLGEVEIE